jgi:hypothetical protein
MSLLTFAMPYYRNPLMLAEQYRIWAGYPEDLKDQIEIVLVDDGSPEPAIDVPRPDGLPSLRIFRVTEDLEWHQHGARNIAAHEASSPWLFLTDMDHVLPAGSLWTLLGLTLDHHPRVFTFHRLDAPHLTPKRDAHGRLHPHVNTFAITKALYWQIGGYDEALCGFYGTDGYFRKRLYAGRSAVHLSDVPVIRYPREVIADASCHDWSGTLNPKAFRDAGRRQAERARVLRSRAGQPPLVLQAPYERVL